MLEFLTKIWKKSAFALFITDTYIQAIEVSITKNKPIIKASAHTAIPQGIIQNGEILDSKKLSAEITQMLAQAQPTPITTKECYLVLPEAQTFEHIFYLHSNLSSDQLQKALDQLVTENIPIPFHEVKYDFHSFPCGKIQAISLVAARRVVISQYYEVVKSLCHLEPLGLEPESLSLMRNIAFDHSQDQGTLLIDFRDHHITALFVWHGSIFDTILSTESAWQENPQQFIQELMQTKDYFFSSTKRQVKELIISGQSPEILKLESYLKTNIQIPIKKITEYQLSEEQFKVPSGALLKVYQDYDFNHINLFKKIQI